MQKLGLVLVLTLSGSIASSTSFAAEADYARRLAHDIRVQVDSGPYHQDRLPDGTLTGPLPSDNPNG